MMIEPKKSIERHEQVDVKSKVRHEDVKLRSISNIVFSDDNLWLWSLKDRKNKPKYSDR